MGVYLDLDDVVGGHPVAEQELAALRASLEGTRGSLQAEYAMNEYYRERAEKAEQESRRLRARLDAAEGVVGAARSMVDSCVWREREGGGVSLVGFTHRSGDCVDALRSKTARYDQGVGDG